MILRPWHSVNQSHAFDDAIESSAFSTPRSFSMLGDVAGFYHQSRLKLNVFTESFIQRTADYGVGSAGEKCYGRLEQEARPEVASSQQASEGGDSQEGKNGSTTPAATSFVAEQERLSPIGSSNRSGVVSSLGVVPGQPYITDVSDPS